MVFKLVIFFIRIDELLQIANTFTSAYNFYQNFILIVSLTFPNLNTLRTTLNVSEELAGRTLGPLICICLDV